MADDILEPIEPHATTGESPAAVDMTAEPAQRRGRKGVAIVGIVALLGVGAIVAGSLGGDGGADSPEAAVRQLVAAVENEDLLAAVAVMAPDEVRTLDRTVDALARRAAEAEIVRSAAKPLAGIDVTVSDLELEVEDLADGYAKVTVGHARIAVDVDRGELAPLIGEQLEDDPDVDPFDVSDIGIDPFIVAVRDGDGWYVSPAYTVLENLRVANDLPGPEFGSGRAQAAELGAESPEAAVREAVEGIASSDFDRVWNVLPPHEIPVYDYRAALAELMGDVSVDVEVESFDASAQVDGDRATVAVTANGTDGDGLQWELRGRCWTTSDTSEPDFGSRICLGGRGILPLEFSLFGTSALAQVNDEAVFVVDRVDGRWYVSPVGSSLRLLDDWVDGFDRRAALSLIGRAELLDADRTITIGETVTGRNAEFGLAYVYEFEGRVGQLVRLDVGDDTFGGFYFFPTTGIFGPDGEEITEPHDDIFYGDAVELPVDGTYKLVVPVFNRGEFEFTLAEGEGAELPTIVTTTTLG